MSYGQWAAGLIVVYCVVLLAMGMFGEKSGMAMPDRWEPSSRGYLPGPAATPMGPAARKRPSEKVTAQRLAAGLDQNDEALEVSDIEMREYNEAELTKSVREHGGSRDLYGEPRVSRTASGAMFGMERS